MPALTSLVFKREDCSQRDPLPRRRCVAEYLRDTQTVDQLNAIRVYFDDVEVEYFSGIADPCIYTQTRARG